MTIQALPRSPPRERKERRDPLDVFRQFIACLERASRKPGRAVKSTRQGGRKR